MANIQLIGASGQVYLYQECDLYGVWNPVPGNYAFLDNSNVVDYLGQTNDLSKRKPGPTHETWALAQRFGATKVVARVNTGGEAARKAEEADLIAAYDPPANKQLRPKPRVATPPLRSSILFAPKPRNTLLGG